ncbi:hypothetical protein GCM10009753_27660 [Streptantibioticus ferralitis]
MGQEWINPKYAQVVADLRQRQAEAPEEQCTSCRGAGTHFEPAPDGAAQVTCRPCGGSGAQQAGFRMFVTS